MAIHEQMTGSGTRRAPVHKRLASHIQAKAEQWRRIELLAHLAGFVVVAVLFWLAVSALRSADVNACLKHEQLDSTPGYFLAGITVAGFLAGRGVAWFRRHVRAGLNVAAPAKSSTGLGILLVLFLAVAALLLGYETWSVANGSVPPPVTSYVRCAAYHQFPLPAAPAAPLGFMLSTWLWFPSK